MSFSRFFRIAAREKLAHALRRRQPACQVKTNTAQEFAIARQGRGRNSKAPQLIENVVINEIETLRFRIVRHGGSDHAHRSARYLAGGSHDNRGLTGSRRLDDAGVANLRHIAVVRFVGCLIGEVFGAAISEMGGNQEMMRGASLEGHYLGEDFKAGHLVIHRYFGTKWRAVFDPLQNLVVLSRTDWKALPAAVLHARFRSA